MKNRSLIALSAVALAVVSATARTVYTPAAATALSGTNPSTDAAGGVWGFYKTSGEMSPRTALAGEFFGATEGVQALFGGLQIAGASFPDYVPTGTLLLVR